MERVQLRVAALLIASLAVPASILYILLELPYRGFAAIAGVLALALLAVRLAQAAAFVDRKLGREIGDLTAYSSYSRSFPNYRFVDLHRAVAAVARELDGVLLAVGSGSSMSAILSGSFYDEDARRATRPEQMSRITGYATEEFFANDGFWIVERAPSTGAPAAAMTGRC